MSIQNSPLLLTVPEAARELRVHRSYVEVLIREKKLASVKVGRRRLLQPSAISDFISKSADK